MKRSLKDEVAAAAARESARRCEAVVALAMRLGAKAPAALVDAARALFEAALAETHGDAGDDELRAWHSAMAVVELDRAAYSEEDMRTKHGFASYARHVGDAYQRSDKSDKDAVDKMVTRATSPRPAPLVPKPPTIQEMQDRAAKRAAMIAERDARIANARKAQRKRTSVSVSVVPKPKPKPE